MELLWCQFFVDAYNKGIYEFVKDFVVPIATIGGSIWVAFAVANRQIKDSKALEISKREQLLNGYFRIISFTVPKIITGLEDRLESLKKSLSTFSLSDNVPFIRSNYKFSTVEVITSIPYIDALDSISEFDNEKRELYSEFYFAVKILQATNDEYNEFLEKSADKLNELTSEFLKLLNIVFIHYQKLIFAKEAKHKVMIYRASVEEGRLESYPDKRLLAYSAYLSEIEHFYYYVQSKGDINSFNVYYVTLGGLILMSRRREFLEWVDIEITQNLQTMIAILDKKKGYLDNLKDTTNNYIEKFDSYLGKIINLQQAINSKKV